MNTQSKFNPSIQAIALVTVSLLLIPLIAMQFSEEVNWGIADFILAGALLFGTGLVFRMIIQRVGHLTQRIALGLALGSTLLLIWVNLAVGLIGAGANTINLMYIGVVLIGIGGTSISGLKAKSMERVMYAMTASLVLIGAATLLMGTDENPTTSVNEILAVNGFFGLLFLTAGLLFRHAVHAPSNAEKQ